GRFATLCEDPPEVARITTAITSAAARPTAAAISARRRRLGSGSSIGPPCHQQCIELSSLSVGRAADDPLEDDPRTERDGLCGVVEGGPARAEPTGHRLMARLRQQLERLAAERRARRMGPV